MSRLNILVGAAASPLAMVEAVEYGADGARVFVTDCIPGGGKTPWCIEIREHADFDHPLFGPSGPHLDFALPLLSLDPLLPDYLDRVAGHAAPCLDHQRFALGAQLTWEPDSGQFAVRALLATDGLTPEQQLPRVRQRIRAVGALALLTAFRVWQLALRRDLPESQTDPMVQAVWNQMMAQIEAPGA